jgi:hypothetical protein
MKRLAATAVAALSCALAQCAQAQVSDAWRFDAALYLYLPSMSGTTTFPTGGGPGSDVGLDLEKILNSLQGAFMGTLQVSKGRYGAFTDIVYVDFSNSRAGTHDLSVGERPLPIDVTAGVNLGLKGAAWTLAGTYLVLSESRSSVELLAGARLLDIKQTFDWQLAGNIGNIPVPAQGGHEEASLHNWDAIVGAKGRYAFGADKAWFVPFYVDAGAGNSQSTWQVMAGLGYSFKWGDIVGAYRQLDYRMGSGKPIQTLNFSGPQVAAVFHW